MQAQAIWHSGGASDPLPLHDLMVVERTGAAKFDVLWSALPPDASQPGPSKS